MYTHTFLSLFDITASHDDKVLSRLGQSRGAVESKSRRGARDDDEFSQTNFESAENLGHLLGLGNVVLLGNVLVLKEGGSELSAAVEGTAD